MRFIRSGLLRRDILLLSLVCILGIWLRCFRLGHQGIWFDEAWSWGVAQLSIPKIIKLSLLDPHPPLYYLLVKAFQFILPQTEAGLRSLSVIFSLLGLVTVIFFASRWWNFRAGFFAGIIFALSSFDIYYAQETRMYTLLAVLWFLSYAFLVEAAQSRPRLLLAWLVINILLSYSHVYGLIVVYAYLVVLVGLWCWYRLRRSKFFYDFRWFWTSVSFSFVFTLPVLFLIIYSRESRPGGAWVPGATDLLALFTLISTGLASARHQFLDGNHLTIPALSTIPLGFWLAAGLLTAVCVVHALRTDWKASEIGKLRAGLAIPSFALPVLIYLFLSITQGKFWSPKPYLGMAYIFYLWAGAGIYRFSAPARYAAIAFIIITSISSLFPYYTTWHKSNAHLAFADPALSDENSLVLIHPAYQAPVAYYYLPSRPTLWGVTYPGIQRSTPQKILPSGILREQYQSSVCSEVEIQSAERIFVFGNNHLIRSEWENWPPCFIKKPLYIFEDNRWLHLNP